MNAAAAPTTMPMPADVRAMNAAALVLALLALTALGAGAASWLARQSLFPLRVVQLQGDIEHSDAATLRNQVTRRITGGFFGVDLQAVREAFEGAPWVRGAVVRRVWPDRLVVRLEEHRPAALWAGAGAGQTLVNTHGELFDANLGDLDDDALPTLAGPAGSAAQVLAMHARLAPLFEALPWRIARLTLSDRGSWKVLLSRGAVVEIGRGSDDEVVARTARFVRTLPRALQDWQRPLEYADLRHADGYAVRLQGMTTAAAASAPGAPATP